MKKNRKHLLITLCLMLVVCVVSVGGTLAWLTDKTDAVVNTFAPTDIDVELTETTPNDRNNIEIVPGVNIDKNPIVTATSDVDYYVFVKVTEENWPTWTKPDSEELKVSYSIDSEWGDPISSSNGVSVYCIAVSGGTALDQEVLTDSKVYVHDSVTKEELATLTAKPPKLTFQAYAIQQDGFTDAAAAWAEVSK